MMHIHCLGLNHQTAQVALRERMAFNGEKTIAALARLTEEHSPHGRRMAGMVILSTCNRVELYAVSPEKEPAALLAFLAETHGISPRVLKPHLYHQIDQAAVDHLFRVAAGLDSLVLGEPQILGQVAGALEMAQSQDSSEPVLTRLFQNAIHAGKRARSETLISRSPASVSSLAASLAGRFLPALDQAQVVVIGAGEMAELAVEALRKRGVTKIVVVSRTLERAHELATRWNARAATFEQLEQILATADILISSTSAPHTILHSAVAMKIMQNRPDHPLVAIDIAVPRDIDPEAANIPGFHLFDIDHLNQKLEQSLGERTLAVPQVEAILAEEETRFMEYFKTLDILPVIAELRNQAEAIRQAELDKTLRRMPELTDAEARRIEALTQALVKKLIGAPITRLRAEAQCPHLPDYTAVVRTLYGLDGQEHDCGLASGPCPFRQEVYSLP